jgi:hypothetical protein
MGRTPNDDRSDGKNPNNDAYWSNEANHERQTGGTDDDDHDAARSRPVRTIGWVEPAPAPSPRRDVDAGPCVIIGRAPSHVPGLYLKCVSRNGQREKTIKVDSASIEAAMGEALALWEQGGLAFMALYSKTSLLLEKTQLEEMSVDMATQLASLGDLLEFIKVTDERLKYARRDLGKFAGQTLTHEANILFARLGQWAAAGTALRAEMAATISGLQASGNPITVASAPASAATAKQYLKAKACSQWIRDFQSGKIRLDAILDAFDQPRPISEIAI